MFCVLQTVLLPDRTGFSAAGKGLYPATVNLIIPATVSPFSFPYFGRKLIHSKSGSNNTLTTGMCPAAVSGRAQTGEFVEIAAEDIAARLNSGAPGASLTTHDAYTIMRLCPFDTVAKEVVSPFCGLFSEDDFKMYEYAGDLGMFYTTGYVS